jgi:RNA polymerase sigma-70 factor, ECF subfamily
VASRYSAAAMMAPMDDWVAVVAEIAAGNSTALAKLYDRCASQVNGLALRILRDPAIAEEVTGDVFMQVWRGAHRFDAQRGSPTAWLLTLTRSRAIDRLRTLTSRRRESHPLPAEYAAKAEAHEPNPEEASTNAEKSQIIRRALGCLSMDQRRVVELAYFEGLSHAEIAEFTGEPLGTVKTRIRIGMGRLREELSSYDRGSL